MPKKPRNHRERARKEYLKIAQKKTKTKKDIHTAFKQQLGYLRRNIRWIEAILETLDNISSNKK